MNFTGRFNWSATAMTMPPLAVPSSLVTARAGDPGDLLELLGLDEAVLACGAVQHQQHLPCSAGKLPLYNAADLPQLVHQVLLVVEPSSGVA